MKQTPKKALVLAGGLPQLELIKKLKHRGIYTILLDYLEQPVAKPYADIFYQESTLDVLKVEEIAKREQVDFVLTVCTDQALLTMAEISEQLHLPCYIDFHTAQAVTNKKYMKEIFLSCGIPTPKARIVQEYDERLVADLEYPLVCKPVDCNSSKGVKKCTTPVELKNAVAGALSLSRSKNIIIEEYKTGIELSVDAFVVNRAVKILLISELQKIRGNDGFVIWKSGMDRKIPISLKKKIHVTLQKIVEAFSLQNCPLLVQLIVSENEEIFVLEFSARTGGGEKYQIIKALTGNDVIENVIRLTLGEDVALNQQKTECFYETIFLYCKKGTYDHTEGIPRLMEQGVISDYYQFRNSGTVFTGETASSSDRVAGYTIIAKTRGELYQKQDIARSAVRVIDVDGNDITAEIE